MPEPTPSSRPTLTLRQSLSRHWPEYLIEADPLGLFLASAGLFTVLFEYPASPLHVLIPEALQRRAWIGLAMGATAVALFYSPWEADLNRAQPLCDAKAGASPECRSVT